MSKKAETIGTKEKTRGEEPNVITRSNGTRIANLRNAIKQQIDSGEIERWKKVRIAS